MNRVIKAIQDTIDGNHAIFEHYKAEAPRTVDVYLGQPQFPEQFESFNPAVYIDYWIDYSNELLYIYLHAIYDFGEDSENFSLKRDKGLEHIYFLKALKHCLRGLKVQPVTGVLNLYQDMPMEADNFHYHQLTLQARYYDDLDDEYSNLVDTEFVASVERGKLKDKK